jgi:hypothetical protein
MRQTVTLTATGSSNPVRLSPNDKQFNVGALISFASGSGSATDIEYTFDRPNMNLGVQDNWADAVWVKDTHLTNLTADDSFLINTPIEAIRLSADTVTSDVKLQVIQGYRGT